MGRTAISMLFALLLILAAPVLAADDAKKKPAKPTGPAITGVPKSLVYAVKMDGPNKHIALSIYLLVENEPIMAIFEGSPLHPNLDALAAIQAEINDGDNETITIKGRVFPGNPKCELSKRCDHDSRTDRGQIPLVREILPIQGLGTPGRETVMGAGVAGYWLGL